MLSFNKLIALEQVYHNGPNNHRATIHLYGYPFNHSITEPQNPLVNSTVDALRIGSPGGAGRRRSRNLRHVWVHRRHYLPEGGDAE